ncbi:hypothetical protein HNP38_003190 [Chryseobacterium defluvii]|uniref:C1q domain-containing protein n=1 Tax=Chryseobacterium defluvii TaxID=160396 RepID=A0A840KJM7_9FLAO|nr:hypothetical protein [Chryseobacterium defluvii]MBB4807874.1 hypothetical protein [Chryseobacterium defluvii]
MKNLFVISALVTFSCFLYAQTGNVGINTVLPGSTLTVSGSIAGRYRNVSTSTALGAGDFYTAYTGSAIGTFTLPAAIAAAPASGNILGRVYYIKNVGAANLTIAASGSELIDNQSGAGVSNVSLTPGGYIMLISKGTASGTTWEVALLINKATPTIAALGASDTHTYTGAAFTNFNNGIPQIVPFSVGDIIVNQGGSAVWNDAGDYWEIKESGIYKIEGYAYFGSGGTVSGTNAFTGINLNITKNGTAITDIIGGNRANLDNETASLGNSPINVNCIVHLNTGDKIYLTMNWAAYNKPTTNVEINSPASLSESRNFSLLQLSATP